MKLQIGFILSFVLIANSIAADTISVVSGSDAVYNAISQSKAGDVLLLSDGEYEETQKWVIQHPLTIQAAENATPKVSMKIKSYSIILSIALSISSSTSFCAISSDMLAILAT